MGLQAFEEEVRAFLRNKNAEVLCITGKWGVGKTFAWNYFLKQAQDAHDIGQSNYAYVSLFGLGSLDDVRRSIFEGTVPSSEATKRADLSTVANSLKTITVKWRTGLNWVRNAPVISDYAALADKLGFVSVREQIVCIDDLERSSKDLSVLDVLGLVSFLKEQRGCKVVLLLNEEAFDEADGKIFRSQVEKAADAILRFEPTPKEAADIGVGSGTPISQCLHEDCFKLGIVNIRTIKKLERFALRLAKLLDGQDPRILKQAVHTATLVGYAKFQPDLAPGLEFIRGFNRYEALLRPNGEEDPNAAWRALIHEYGFGHLDEFDVVIVDGIETGSFDRERLSAEAAKLAASYVHQDRDQSFTQAWDAYHGSFADDADEVLDGMERAIQANAQAISPLNFSSTIGFLKEMGRGAAVPALISHYVDARADEGPEFWDLDQSSFRNEFKDDDVIAAFRAKHATFVDDRDPATLLIQIGLENGWNPEDLTLLARQSPDRFYEIFKRLRNPDLRRAVKGGLMFRQMRDADDAMKAITRNTIAALKRIGGESDINRRRIEQKGVALDDPDPWPAGN